MSKNTGDVIVLLFLIVIQHKVGLLLIVHFLHIIFSYSIGS